MVVSSAFDLGESEMSYENHHVFNDGKIALYTRNGNPTYQARLSVPGIDRYIVKSTKRTNLAEALGVAEVMWNDYWYKARNQLETGTNTFETLYKKWLKAHHVSLSVHRQKYITGTAKRYLLPYFGKYAVSQISDALIERYWDWRRNLWTSEAGKERIETARRQRPTAANPHRSKLGNVAKVPANKSLSMEQTVLRQIFGWAVRTGAMVKMPHVHVPLPKQSSVQRRPSFTHDEFIALRDYLNKWIAGSGASDGDNRKASTNPVHNYHRRLLRNYVLFMQASGLRPNEARQLRWRDMTRIVDSKGDEQLHLSIAPTTKTGARECVPLRHALRIVDDMKEHNARTGREDFVFSDRNGKPIENFGKTFKQVLKDCGLLCDSFGRERVIYSLRHTYATVRIANSQISAGDLAANMGTSPGIIHRHYNHTTVAQRADLHGGTEKMVNGELMASSMPPRSRKARKPSRNQIREITITA